MDSSSIPHGGHWCKIDSTPLVFNALIQWNGIQGVRVQEIYSLDKESFAMGLRDTCVYGLIFLLEAEVGRLSKMDLYPRKETVTSTKSSHGRPPPPPPHVSEDKRMGEGAVVENENEEEPSNVLAMKDIWFANQVIPDACGSQTLLSIVLNVPEIDIGPTLREFKDFTAHFSSLDKGLAMTNCDVLREHHNRLAGRYNAELETLHLSFMKPILTHPTPNINNNNTSEEPNCPIKLTGLTKDPDHNHPPTPPPLASASSPSRTSPDLSKRPKRSQPSPPTTTTSNPKNPVSTTKRPRHIKNLDSEVTNHKTTKKTSPMPMDHHTDMDNNGHDHGLGGSGVVGAAGGNSPGLDEFHYLAYVPMHGYLWELDGLQQRPIRRSSCTRENWLERARIEIKAQIRTDPSNHDHFVLMALVQDPLTQKNVESENSVPTRGSVSSPAREHPVECAESTMLETEGSIIRPETEMTFGLTNPATTGDEDKGVASSGAVLSGDEDKGVASSGTVPSGEDSSMDQASDNAERMQQGTNNEPGPSGQDQRVEEAVVAVAEAFEEPQSTSSLSWQMEQRRLLQEREQERLEIEMMTADMRPALSFLLRSLVEHDIIS